ncbi:MAG: maleylpyruvate isomerase family mycothiol-dependent enzyme [Acidimicrobiia bacterium]|nr:maleylpyruvate isomerase family mycothiol-dependent enzyme [Acidimicrobiia bacterium]
MNDRAEATTDADDEPPVLACLEVVWTSVADLARQLDDDDWLTPSELAGWSVKDCISHMVGVESALLGEPVPDVSVDHLDHVTTDFAAMIEKPVEARRARPAGEVVDEFGTATRRRLEALRAMTPEEWAVVGWSPVGQVPYAQFMEVRVFDCWMHEQDIRRATGRPGHLEGPAAELAFGRIRSAMGFVVGKKAAAPQGSTVVFDIQGPVGDRFTIEVADRASEAADEPADPTVVLEMSLSAFAALGGGRWDRDAALASGEVAISGDEDLASAVLDAMAFTP